MMDTSKTASKNSGQLPFIANVQNNKSSMGQRLNGLPFLLGVQLQDSDLPDYLEEIVFVRKLICEDPVEKLYYSAKFEDICINCSGAVDS